MKSKGLLIVFSGPSGVGKDTVLKHLLEKDPNIRLSVSATTRPPREGEIDGKDYYFLTKEKFQEMAENGEMLESAGYCGNFYGTPKKPIEKWLSEGLDVVLEIEVQGGAQVQSKCPDCVGIFILPPSLKVLENRLRNRRTDSDDVIQKRLMVARDEILQAVHYDYAVINDTVEQAAEEIIHILHAEKHKVQRDNNLIERILNHA
ncbi:guanylate kinase [Caproiciproducens galactitolivorans]|uniref:Guanylate kinase n=1 Tax=Caproiciproducens galactitolivorans TaxID=642589 RepID=A0A4Z0XYF4_9FIRM|nr:guanylate kinase [Caproiciproducens galactitolivorans]QEY34030.1 guanylate kinase [Caproiciproducens galactitolivorans]TGJ76559.1 guanylate kinase [Caproiciproducens galactitolivorans]